MTECQLMVQVSRNRASTVVESQLSRSENQTGQLGDLFNQTLKVPLRDILDTALCNFHTSQT